MFTIERFMIDEFSLKGNTLLVFAYLYDKCDLGRQPSIHINTVLLGLIDRELRHGKNDYIFTIKPFHDDNQKSSKRGF